MRRAKPASLAALRKIYDYALAQEVAPVRVADYIAKVLDFEGMVLAREIRSGDLRVRGAGALTHAQARRRCAGPRPDAKRRLAGIAPGPRAALPDARRGRGAPVLARCGAAPAHLRDANGAVSELARDASGFSFTLTSHVAPTFRLAGAESCGVSVNGNRPYAFHAQRIPPANPAPPLQRYDPDPAGIGRAPGTDKWYAFVRPMSA